MAIDSERRKAVMTRSRKLGHCVCNPKQGCPCETFVDHNVCPCAGEKMPPRSGPIALTQHVRKAGCASKIGQADLLRILKSLPAITDPNVLLGTAAGDDAGIYRLDDERSLVQTVDVFTPCVDDAHLFGRIAAANSLSDVYAMGGKPLTALSVVGFPIDELDGEFMQQMLRGGMETLEEASCALIGGHSINDEEIKCGFAITGLIETARVIARDRAQPGDKLVLTKPLGTGMVSFGAQIGRVSPEGLAEIGASMAALNRDAAELMVEHGANACTDITGFGLAGHLVEMARGSGARAEIDMSSLPVFTAAAECMELEILGGAIERNRDYSSAWVRVAEGQCPRNLPILFDPQTSGGLLVALPGVRAEDYVEAMRARGHASTAIIGTIHAAENGEEGVLFVTCTRLENLVGARDTVALEGPKVPPALPKKKREEEPAPTAESAPACCASPPVFDEETPQKAAPSASAPTTSPAPAGEDSVDARALFADFMALAGKPGRVDGRAKRLVAIALGIAQRCEPCARNHVKAAFAEGITKAEIDEIADLAIEFGGCPALMFYNELLQKLDS